MITIFYGAYPEEITYSWFGRYSFINGDITRTTTSRELFGKKHVTATMLYSINMEYFINQLPTEWNITINEIIDKNTIIPVFLPFMEIERADKVISNIKYGDTRRLRGEIGLNTGDIFTEEANIKICSMCYKEDVEKYEEAYIHRNHQIPGNYICSIHGENLHKYSINLNIDRCEYIDINRIDIEDCELVKIDETYKQLYLNLSKDIDFVLQGYIKEYNINSIKEKYKERLEEKGFFIKGGRIAVKRIIIEFNEFYPKAFLEHLESYIDVENRKNWIGLMLTDSGRFIHPIRQLLFIRFLFGGIEEFIKYEKCFKPFGKAPWLCLNPVCKWYKAPVITKVEYKSNTRKPKGIFTCECGYSYSRVGPDKGEADKSRIGKIESFGWCWEETLKRLIRKGYSIREITRRMDSGTATVIKQATKLGVEGNLNTNRTMEYKENENSINEELINQYKKEILLFIKKNPKYSRQKIKESLVKECSFIYSKDKKWWNDNLPKPHNKSKFTKDYKDIDWEEREKILIPLLLTAIDEIKNNKDQRRITKAYLSKIINTPMLSNKKHLEKLPNVKELLDSKCESINQFNNRKKNY